MQNHRNLKVWQKAHDFCVRLYRVTRALERDDRSGLASQVRRASHSIRANIAEGCSRQTNKDFTKFLQTAIGSASEVEDHLEFAYDVGLIPPNDARPLLEQVVEIRKMLYVKKVQDDERDKDK